MSFLPRHSITVRGREGLQSPNPFDSRWYRLHLTSPPGKVGDDASDQVATNLSPGVKISTPCWQQNIAVIAQYSLSPLVLHRPTSEWVSCVLSLS